MGTTLNNLVNGVMSVFCAGYSRRGLLLNARRDRLRAEALDGEGGNEDRRLAGGVVKDLK
jgi:hypothetical protein